MQLLHRPVPTPPLLTLESTDNEGAAPFPFGSARPGVPLLRVHRDSASVSATVWKWGHSTFSAFPVLTAEQWIAARLRKSPMSTCRYAPPCFTLFRSRHPPSRPADTRDPRPATSSTIRDGDRIALGASKMFQRMELMPGAISAGKTVGLHSFKRRIGLKSSKDL